MPKASTVPNYYIIGEEGDVQRTDDEAVAKYWSDTSVVIDVKANTLLDETEAIAEAPDLDEGDNTDSEEN